MIFRGKGRSLMPSWWPDVLSWLEWIVRWKWWLLATYVVLLGGMLALRIWWPRRRARGRGHATFATRREMRAAGLFDGHGVPLGEVHFTLWRLLWRFFKRPYFLRLSRAYLRVGAQQNVAVFGPKGCGKTVKITMPYLLSGGASDDEESVVVFDPKRELVRLTAQYRESHVGPTYVFAPSEWQSAHINPWDWVRWKDKEVVDAQRLASHIARGEVEGQGQRPISEEGQYYRRWARVMLWGTGLYLHDAVPEQCSFGGMLEFFSQPQTSIPAALDQLVKSRDPIVRRVAGLLLNRTANDQREVFSAAAGWLMDWFDPVLAWNTHDTTIPIDELQGDKPMTVYLCFDPVDLQGGRRPFARLLLDQLFVRMSQRATRAFRRRVRLVFEDMATLGYFPPAEIAAEFYREAGADLLCSFQSMAQIRRHYGHDTSLWDNLDTWVVFRPNHPESAEFFSEKSPELRIDETMAGSSRPEFGLFGQRSSRTVAYTRQLVAKDDLLGLHEDQHLVFVGGQTKRGHAVSPIIAYGRPYFEEPEFCGLVGG